LSKADFSRNFVLFYFLLLPILLTCSEKCLARAGDGHFYRSKEELNPNKPKEQTETTQIINSIIPYNDASEPETNNERKISQKETAEWYEKNVKISHADYIEFRWVGILISSGLLLGGAAASAILVFSADPKETTFLKDALIPVVAINSCAWLMNIACCRSFELPYWPMYSAIVIVASILTYDLKKRPTKKIS